MLFVPILPVFEAPALNGIMAALTCPEWRCEATRAVQCGLTSRPLKYALPTPPLQPRNRQRIHENPGMTWDDYLLWCTIAVGG